MKVDKDTIAAGKEIAKSQHRSALLLHNSRQRFLARGLALTDYGWRGMGNFIRFGKCAPTTTEMMVAGGMLKDGT